MSVIRATSDRTSQPGQSPSDRRAQTVTVTVAFTLTVILLCLFTRLYMRWPWNQLMSKKNDGLAIAATLLALAQAAAIEVAVSHELGHPLEDLSNSDKSTVRTCVLVAQLLFYMSAAVASMSVVEFIIALKSQVKIWLVDIVLRLVTPIWGLAGIIVCAVYLGLAPSAMPSTVPIALGVVACIIQLATFTAAVMITKNLQTNRMTKTRVLLGFSPCFLVVAAFIVSMIVVPGNIFGDQFSTADINYIITLQVILLFLIIYATTPALLQIGKRFQTGYSAAVIGENGNTMSGSIQNRSTIRRARTNDDSYGMKSFNNQQIVSTISTHDKLDRGHIRSPSRKPTKHESGKQQGREGDGMSVASDSSQKIIISKTVTQHSVNI